jgi:hypothetical protein
VSDSLVGLTGGPPVICEVFCSVVVVVALLSEEPGGKAQSKELAQTRSVWQHPPPSDAGHGLKSGRQASGVIVGSKLEVVTGGISGGGRTVVTEVVDTVEIDDIVEGGGAGV